MKSEFPKSYEHPSESKVSALIARFQLLFENYDKKIMTPAIEELLLLLKKREQLAAGNERDRVDAEITKVTEDIGVLGRKLPNIDLLSKVYARLEEFRMKQEARIIDKIRLRSYHYALCDGKNVSYEEVDAKIRQGTRKLEEAMSNW